MSGRYWRTPPDLYARLNAEFGFDFDPCPCPRPEGYDSLKIPWGKSNYVNPPFRRHDGFRDGPQQAMLPEASMGVGPTAWVHKAIAEHKQGRGSVLVLPVQSYVMLLAEAGAEVRSLGRVPWLEVETGKPMKSPSPICAFILRGAKQ